MSNHRLADALSLGLPYGGGLFVVGFIFGVIRTLWLVDLLGESTAILLEIPIMLAIAWAWCGRLTSRTWMGRSGGARLVMGLSGLITLLTLEVASAIALTGSLAAYLAGLGGNAQLAGLTAQLMTGAIPFLRR